MDAIECILTRRSIRRFTARSLSDAQWGQLLAAAAEAPSAFDERPWEFIVVRETATLRTLDAQMPKCDALKTATGGLLLCGVPALEKYPGYWPQDCAACAQNVQLAAHALDLGCVWLALVGIPDREAAIRACFGLPERLTPFALLALGEPAETPDRALRYDADRVHYDRWPAVSPAPGTT
ncbi:MAG: nitroreductase family protein [Candidatus Marinimicrobia bacterium]|nr:nitroreductase family protein [Candidatus Neomarinimicrobiota bacterium]